MDYKIIIIAVGVTVGIVAIILGLPQAMKTGAPQVENQSLPKESASPSQSFPLPANYTLPQLLDYCSQNDSLVYDDSCIRGLWDVSDECQSENFSSMNPVCSDPRLGQFENKVTNEMHDLNTSLENFVSSCMNVTSDNDIGNCYFNMERIKSDCTEPKYVSMMPICNDSRFDQFEEKYKDALSKLSS